MFRWRKGTESASLQSINERLEIIFNRLHIACLSSLIPKSVNGEELIVPRQSLNPTVPKVDFYQPIGTCETNKRCHRNDMLIPRQFVRIALLRPFAALPVNHVLIPTFHCG